MACKIELLEASIHEESWISINKISNLKLKHLGLVKSIEGKDQIIEQYKKEKKEMWLKASSQRRIAWVMQEKIDKLSKTVKELELENEKLTKRISKFRRCGSSNSFIKTNRSNSKKRTPIKGIVKPREAYIDLNSDKSTFTQ